MQQACYNIVYPGYPRIMNTPVNWSFELTEAMSMYPEGIVTCKRHNFYELGLLTRNRI